MSRIANVLKIHRPTMYMEQNQSPKLYNEPQDEDILKEMREVLESRPTYGHKRITAMINISWEAVHLLASLPNDKESLVSNQDRQASIFIDVRSENESYLEETQLRSNNFLPKDLTHEID